MASMDYQPFPNTHWSLVRRAGGNGARSTDTPDSVRSEALATLLARYQPALRSYLRVVRHMPAADADETLQAFIADQLLEHELLRRADQSRGRFRTLLLTSLNNFATSRGRAARIRATESLEPHAEFDANAPAPSAAVEYAWARALVHEVILTMRVECDRTARSDIWAVFEGRILAEVFNRSENGTPAQCVSYEELATRLKLASPTQAANLLVTAKRMYARLLRAAVAEYERNAQDIDAEIADLRQILQTPPDSAADE